MRNSLVYVLIVIALGAILYSVRAQSAPKSELTISEVANEIERGTVERIVVAENDLTIYFRPGAAYELATARKESASTAPEQFATLGVNEQARGSVQWEVQGPGDWGNIMALLSYTLPAIFVIGFIYFILRQAQGTNNQAMSFGKSKARMVSGDQPTVTFLPANLVGNNTDIFGASTNHFYRSINNVLYGLCLSVMDAPIALNT